MLCTLSRIIYLSVSQGTCRYLTEVAVAVGWKTDKTIHTYSAGTLYECWFFEVKHDMGFSMRYHMNNESYYLHLALASCVSICARIECLASSIACCLSWAFAWFESPVPWNKKSLLASFYIQEIIAADITYEDWTRQGE